MQSVFFAVLLTLFTLGNASEDGPMKPDGRMWANFGASSQQGIFIKSAYVQGAIEGLRVGAIVGYTSGRLDEKNDALTYIKECVEKGPCATVPIARMIRPESAGSWDEVMASADKVGSKFVVQRTSVLDIVHQMDKFYTDYRNTPICMIVAVQESIASLGGKASTEKDLQMMREQGCNP